MCLLCLFHNVYTTARCLSFYLLLKRGFSKADYSHGVIGLNFRTAFPIHLKRQNGAIMEVQSVVNVFSKLGSRFTGGT